MSDSPKPATGAEVRAAPTPGTGTWYFRVPLAELTTLREGKIVYTNRWWAVTRNDEALFHVAANRKFNSPQCNHDRRLLLLPAGCKAVFVPVAYLDHSCHDHV